MRYPRTEGSNPSPSAISRLAYAGLAPYALFRRRACTNLVRMRFFEPIRYSDSRRAAWVHAAAGVVLLDLALIAPNAPYALTLDALRMIPLELPVLLLALVFVPAPWRRVAAWLVGGALGVMGLVKAADLGSRAIFGFPFNPLIDWHRLEHAWSFFERTVGPLAVIAAIAATLAVGYVMLRLLVGAAARVAVLPDRVGQRAALTAVGMVIAVVGAADLARRTAGWDTRTAAFTTTLAWNHIATAREARRDLARFREELRGDPLADADGDGLFARLRGRDVVVVFAESYGRTVLARDRYRRRVRPALADLESAAAGKGLALRSGWLESPTVGGRTWLAHSAFVSGAWTDRQRRHDALVRSTRTSLAQLFGRAGWRTAAVVPSNRPPWPAGEAFAYDSVLDARTLDYAGKPFNWVTMPDQYTLSALHERVLEADREAPAYAEAVLISGHAPWTPIPELVPWDAVGDGRIFNRFAERGPAPTELWRDTERVRTHYGRAMAYVVRTLAGFVRERLNDDTVLLVVGDHQPAPLITGEDATHQVPVHLIAPPEVTAATRAWGWSAGAVPAGDAPVWRMDSVRGRLVDAFAPRLRDGEAVTWRRRD